MKVNTKLLIFFDWNDWFIDSFLAQNAHSSFYYQKEEKVKKSKDSFFIFLIGFGSLENHIFLFF